MNRQDLTLLTDLYELTMMQGYYEQEANEIVVLRISMLPYSLVDSMFVYRGTSSNERIFEPKFPMANHAVSLTRFFVLLFDMVSPPQNTH